MVGVPGKSKGCSTCRRRKKGCDQKRPTCGNCASSGYVCGGYQRNLAFIIHPASKSANKAYFVPHNARTVKLALMPSFDRAALETQCRSLFWDLYLPHGTAGVQDGMLEKCNQPPNWMNVLLELDSEELTLDLAFSALSISRVGRANNDLRLVKEGNKLYGNALKDLQKALYDSSRMHTDEILAVCSVLGLYEIFEGGCDLNRSIGWISHAEGTANLIKLRGPLKHCNRQAHHIFLGARLPIIYSAMVRRKKTFLADQDWIGLPFSDSIKTYYEVLVDLAAQLPKLLEDLDGLRAKAHTSSAQAEIVQLLRDVCDYQTTLTEWETGKKNSSRPVSLRHDKAVSDDIYPFDTELSWENHVYMNASLVYWATQLMVSATLSQLESLRASLGFATPETYTGMVSAQQRARQFAVLIAQSVPFALMPDMGALGISHITFPLCLAFKQFVEANDEEICNWLISVRNDMRRQGVHVGMFQDSSSSSLPRGSTYLGQLNESGSSVKSEEASLVVTPNSAICDEEEHKIRSPSSIKSSRSFLSTFIYENPAQFYIDTTEPP